MKHSVSKNASQDQDEFDKNIYTQIEMNIPEKTDNDELEDNI